MIPTETSTNLRSAMVRVGAERGIRTMIARVMFAQRLRNLLQTKCDRQQSDENNRKHQWERKPAAPSLLRLRANARNLRRGWLLISYVYIPPGPRDPPRDPPI
jgi:hypothetical protein